MALENSTWIYPDHPYTGRTVVLATKHGKLPLIGPALESTIGMKVANEWVDTDILGTFTEDIRRKGSPLDTAIAKARMGMRSRGESLGLASEGSVGPDPALPLLISDEEIVVLVDDESRLITWETNTSFDIVRASATLRPGELTEAFLSEADFPRHKLTARPNDGHINPIWKGISDPEELDIAINECSKASSDGLALIQTDLRAHTCPSRQKVIAGAAQRLADRLMARCPQCKAPGWGETGRIFGIPCSSCGTEVQLPRSTIKGCAFCNFHLQEPITGAKQHVDPSQCPRCNP